MSVKKNRGVRKGIFTKQDHINYWISTANKDWQAIKKMLECRTYVHALFFMHLVLEKLVKAHWVKDNSGNHPPKIHDLVKLSQQTKLHILEDDIDFLRQMNMFQLEGRYPGYTQNLFRIYNRKRTYIKFESVNTLRKCLLKKLQ